VAGARVIGTDFPRRGTKAPAEDAAMAAIGKPRRTPDELRAEILALLEKQPLMKWQIREQLHEPEAYILRQLNWLRDEGQLRVVGHTTDRRAWALASWKEDSKLLPKVRPFTTAPKVPAPETSWWVARDDAEFKARQQERARVARWD
jgi:hypothetical protein